MDSKKEYEKKRQLVVNQLREIIKTNSPIALSKRTSNLFRERKQIPTPKLQFKDFNKVIKIDRKNLIAEVEAATTYKDFVNQTLKYGLLPAVVPELATITVGGAVSGGGIEATSFKYGLVHETILEMEILLSNGDVVTAAPDNKFKDLFYSVIGSYGSLGYILKLKVKLIKADQYVKLSYYYFDDKEDFFRAIGRIFKTHTFKNKPVDFLDGMVLSPHQLYLITGQFTGTTPFLSHYTYMKQFYRSIPLQPVDYLTTKDFIWRWDTDWFWCSKNFGMENMFLRLLVGKFMLNSTAYWKLIGLDRKYNISKTFSKLSLRNKPREFVIQDVQIPLKHAPEFFDFFNKKLGITPFWICPAKQVYKKRRYPFLPLDPKEYYINFGFWDSVPTKPSLPKHYFNRLVEKEVIKLHGHKGLYSDVYFSKDEFWNIYDKTQYETIKKKYDPENRLKDIYEKCVKTSH